MKKILLLAGILVIGATSFAEDVQEGQAEEKLKVSANVVEDLIIETKEVKFGNVAAGMTLKQPKEEGKITIKALKDSVVQVKLYDNNGNEIVKNGTVDLYKAGIAGASANLDGDFLKYTPNFVGETFRMNSDNHEIVMNGKLVVPEKAYNGEYSNQLTVKAKYISFGDN